MGEIARALDIPRPTVYRLLETLEEERLCGVVAEFKPGQGDAAGGKPGDGFAATSELCQVSGPIFADYGRKAPLAA